jgi:hypothetical protein
MDGHGAQDLSRTESLALVAELRADNAALQERIAALEVALAQALVVLIPPGHAP